MCSTFYVSFPVESMLNVPHQYPMKKRFTQPVLTLLPEWLTSLIKILKAWALQESTQMSRSEKYLMGFFTRTEQLTTVV